MTSYEATSDAALRMELRQLASSDDLTAIRILLLDYALFLAGLALAVFSDSLLLQAAGAILTGAKISSLFVIGHDCAHGIFFKTRWANEAAARLAFWPALHNATLWKIRHNLHHHHSPNVKGLNSWAPMTKEEFDAAPLTRRLAERLYRSIVGFPFYYLVERWFRNKLFPTARNLRGGERHAKVALLDFIGICAFLGLWVGGGYLAAEAYRGASFLNVLFFAFLLPFFIWNALMGITSFLQHVHPQVPWFRSKQEMEEAITGQHELTLHARVPGWYHVISNNVMAHPAHHVHPAIPLYRLREAQGFLTERLGEQGLIEEEAVNSLLKSVRACKLYDYEQRRWLTFDGRPSAEV